MINLITQILIKNNVIIKDDLEIYEYGLFVIIFNILSISMIILIGLLVNQLSYTLSFLLFYLPNRMILGGYHCKTPISCFITFCSTYLLILILSQILILTPYYYIIVIIYSSLLILNIKKKNMKLLMIIHILFILITLFIPVLQNALIYALLLNIMLYSIKKVKEIV